MLVFSLVISQHELCHEMIAVSDRLAEEAQVLAFLRAEGNYTLSAIAEMVSGMSDSTMQLFLDRPPNFSNTPHPQSSLQGGSGLGLAQAFQPKTRAPWKPFVGVKDCVG